MKEKRKVRVCSSASYQNDPVVLRFLESMDVVDSSSPRLAEMMRGQYGYSYQEPRHFPFVVCGEGTDPTEEQMELYARAVMLRNYTSEELDETFEGFEHFRFGDILTVESAFKAHRLREKKELPKKLWAYCSKPWPEPKAIPMPCAPTGCGGQNPAFSAQEIIDAAQ